MILTIRVTFDAKNKQTITITMKRYTYSITVIHPELQPFKSNQTRKFSRT